MKPKAQLSIIIPAYNAGHCIQTCLGSILTQNNVQNAEIIVVNDGSTDDTAQIVQRYNQTFPNIKLISQKNMGPSVARNNGMQHAQGEFITFVDADDAVGVDYKALCSLFQNARMRSVGSLNMASVPAPQSPKFKFKFRKDYFTKMIDVMQRDTDIDVVLAGKITLETSMRVLTAHIYNDFNVLDDCMSHKGIALHNAYLRETANFTMYRRSMLEKNNLQFMPQTPLDEDILFCMQAVLHANYVAVIPDCTYLYYRHQNSASNPTNYWAAYDLSAIQHMSALLNDLYKFPQYRPLFSEWLREFIRMGNTAQNNENAFPNGLCADCPNRFIPSRCFVCAPLKARIRDNIKQFLR